MSQDGVNESRRRFLYIATGAVGAVGAVGVATPFVKSWFPSEKAKAVGAPVKVDVGGLKLGEMVIAEWRGKPIFILRRTPESIGVLKDADFKSRLVDPESSLESQQPTYAQNDTRALGDELLVLEGVCTHLGCSPKFVPEVEPQTYDADWQGGFFCPCHGSRFDLAGRVFKNVPAPSNMKVPPHRIDGGVITIGEETV
ncbi:ubiquinol-cytochrome c reductase iron-sulfur subunit [Reinekea marinisedimentorum]|uniref:Ubiquinol-cytochrome c reductase iron-sulfur subunit n=1 Tax=Reinekea marinisedimentorum TaxID=230495 RepID=A0A4R3HSS0_9GAMM|nr:ubiquinol-cytochrome c reductase iron-sulfur subunit [Reinekea marinisedimentorum]TCS36177.1 ubiquinol-cytochrome c reductase iron-sulfur subunit [Reinekea marinisedimentorum]